MRFRKEAVLLWGRSEQRMNPASEKEAERHEGTYLFFKRRALVLYCCGLVPIPFARTFTCSMCVWGGLVMHVYRSKRNGFLDHSGPRGG